MTINYAAVQDLYQPQLTPGNMSNGKVFCMSCKKTLDEKNFFKTNRSEKFANGILPHCKTCVAMGVDDTDETTFLSILKEIDIPYIPSEWRALVVKKTPKSPSILGKYVSKMRLNQFKKYRWADTEELVKKESQNILMALRQESDSESEAEAKLEEMLSMSDLQKPKMGAMVQNNSNGPNVAALYGLTPETSKYGLSQEEIDEIKLNWGPDYTEAEYLQLEQLFTDMKESYIIQDPVAISNAKMICKMTMKMNKFLDIDDVESMSKISRQLDLFIKTANLAPVQQKDRQQTTFAISQLAYLIEKEGGFIPDFYCGKPNDKIDQVLADMEAYTQFLVKGEEGLADMVANTESILAQDQLPDAQADMDDFETLEKELMGDIEALEDSDEDEKESDD